MEKDLDFHTDNLSKYCRICGGRLQKAKSKTAAPTHPCSGNRDCLWSTFKVDINTDDSQIHPARFCNRCWAATQKHRMAFENGKEYQCSISPFLWEEHNSQCKVSLDSYTCETIIIHVHLHVHVHVGMCSLPRHCTKWGAK